MKSEIKEYLDSIIEYKISKVNGYDLLEFDLKFDKYVKNTKLCIGNESLKLNVYCECPICNMDVFIEMNEFNKHSDLFKCYHDDEYVRITTFMFYNSLIDIKDIFNSLRIEDYEYIVSLLNTIDKVNRIDKAELLGDVISMLGGKDE